MAQETTHPDGLYGWRIERSGDCLKVTGVRVQDGAVRGRGTLTGVKRVEWDCGPARATFKDADKPAVLLHVCTPPKA